MTPSPGFDDELSRVTEKIYQIVQKMTLQDRLKLLSDLESHEKGKGAFRRKHPRKDYRVQVDYTVEGKLYTGLSVDLSADGIFIETSRTLLPRFKQGDEIVLTFRHPEKKEHVKVTGRIARVDESGGIGVQFDQSIFEWLAP